MVKQLLMNFLKPTHAGSLVRMMHFKKEVKNINYSSVLDAGCGGGQYSFYLAKQKLNASVTAYDINTEQIERLVKESKERGILNIEFAKRDLTEIDDIEKFDFVVCIDVLEHIKDDEKAIESLYKSLKSGGKIYIRVPGKNQFRYFKQLEKHSQEDHVREGYTIEQMKQLLTNAGFKITHTGRTFGKYGDLAWELYMINTTRPHVLYLFNPLIRLLAWLDVRDSNKKHNNFYILAQK